MDRLDNKKKEDSKKSKRKYKDLINSIQNNNNNNNECYKENKDIIDGIGGGNFKKIEKI